MYYLTYKYAWTYIYLCYFTKSDENCISAAFWSFFLISLDSFSKLHIKNVCIFKFTVNLPFSHLLILCVIFSSKLKFLNVIKPFLCHVFNERLFFFMGNIIIILDFKHKKSKKKIVDLISAALKRCNPMTRALTMKWLSILK